MPCLRIYAPEFSFEQKKIMAAELTDAILQALALPEEIRQQTTIHFIPYRLENMAVNGRLLSETEQPGYQLEFQSFTLTHAQKEALVRHLMPLLLELLGVTEMEANRILLVFQEYPRDSLAIGGRFWPESENPSTWAEKTSSLSQLEKLKAPR